MHAQVDRHDALLPAYPRPAAVERNRNRPGELHDLHGELRIDEGLGDEPVKYWRGPLPQEQALALAARIAGALGYAHRRGIVHRDVTPRNVFLCRGRVEEAKVLDFGLARLGVSSLTTTGETPMPPGSPGLPGLPPQLAVRWRCGADQGSSPAVQALLARG